MFCPPYVLRWIDDLCYWVRLSKDGTDVVQQSPLGFASEEEARSNYMWWNAT
jgi:hypothetical protein